MGRRGHNTEGFSKWGSHCAKACAISAQQSAGTLINDQIDTHTWRTQSQGFKKYFPGHLLVVESIFQSQLSFLFTCVTIVVGVEYTESPSPPSSLRTQRRRDGRVRTVRKLQ